MTSRHYCLGNNFKQEAAQFFAPTLLYELVSHDLFWYVTLCCFRDDVSVLLSWKNSLDFSFIPLDCAVQNLRCLTSNPVGLHSCENTCNCMEERHKFFSYYISGLYSSFLFVNIFLLSRYISRHDNYRFRWKRSLSDFPTTVFVGPSCTPPVGG
jgi:hypothetical protein